MKYCKKPIAVEAVRFLIGAVLPDWAAAAITLTEDEHGGLVGYIGTLEGQMRCNLGDWIIRGIHGEVYPCKHDIFEKTYEEVKE